ncbi:translationally-controlled tumor protein homolog [Argonauta hians]
MIIYNDLFTNDELFTDIYKIKTIHDVAFEIEGKYLVSKSESFTLSGANPSAEAADEDYDDSSASGIDIVIAHRLNEISIDKNSFIQLIKEHVKKVLAKLTEEKSDRVDIFKTNSPVVVKSLLKRFADLRFFVGESQDMSGSLMILDFREDNETPYFTVFKDALEEVKV